MSMTHWSYLSSKDAVCSPELSCEIQKQCLDSKLWILRKLEKLHQKNSQEVIMSIKYSSLADTLGGGGRL